MFQEIDNLKSLGEGSFLYFCKGSGVAGSESRGCEILEKGHKHKMMKFLIIVYFHVSIAL